VPIFYSLAISVLYIDSSDMPKPNSTNRSYRWRR